MEKDQHGNVVQGNVAALATQNSMIKSIEDTLIATYSVADLIIVQHDHVVMICSKNQAQKVKVLVAHIKTIQVQEVDL